MGCDLIYNNRALVQLQTGKGRICRIWCKFSSEEITTKLVSIQKSLGPNKWLNCYITSQKRTKTLANNSYYWIEGTDVRYLFVDSNGDAWLFPTRVDFELAIANYSQQGPAFHLQNAIHYSQVTFPQKVTFVPNRYARIIANISKVFPVETTKSKPTESQLLEVGDPLKDILDFEFNKPKPPKMSNPYGLDFDAIARDAIELGK
jgi:hypothetical protein